MLAPNHVPPWQDAKTLAANLSVSPATIHRWAKTGRLPRGKKVVPGKCGTRLWQWSEVERMLGGKASGTDWEKRIDEAQIESRRRHPGQGNRGL